MSCLAFFFFFKFCLVYHLKLKKEKYFTLFCLVMIKDTLKIMKCNDFSYGYMKLMTYILMFKKKSSIKSVQGVNNRGGKSNTYVADSAYAAPNFNLNHFFSNNLPHNPTKFLKARQGTRDLSENIIFIAKSCRCCRSLSFKRQKKYSFNIIFLVLQRCVADTRV